MSSSTEKRPTFPLSPEDAVAVAKACEPFIEKHPPGRFPNMEAILKKLKIN